MSQEAAAQESTNAAVAESTDSTGILATDDTAAVETDGAVLAGDEETDTEGQSSDTEETDTEDKDKEEAEGVPEKYEFEFPEGVQMDEAAMEVFDPVLRDLELTNEQGQKLATALVEYQGKQQAQVQAVFDTLRAEALKMPAEQIGLAKRALKYAGKEADGIKADPYLNSHPAVIRALAALGKPVSEAKFREAAAGQGSAPQTFEDRANQLYSDG